VNSIPDGYGEEEGSTLRCHELARVVSLLLELPVVDGRCGGVEHSWIEWYDRTRHRTILDAYVPGRLPQVQLIHDPIGMHNLWQEGEFRDDIRWEVINDLLKIVSHA